MARIDLRLTDEEKEQATKQAESLGLSISEYFRLIVKLDAASGIMKKLKES